MNLPVDYKPARFPALNIEKLFICRVEKRGKSTF